MPNSIATSVAPIRLTKGWRGVVRVPVDANDVTHCPSLAQWSTLLEALCDDPSSLADYSLLKNSPDAQVISASMTWTDGSREIIGKRDKTVGLASKCVSIFRASRARRNFDRARALLSAGLHTAEPLAAIECGMFKSDSWIVTHRVEGLIDLDQVALMSLARIEVSRSRAVKNQVIQAIVEFFIGLERAGLTHRDLKASNILLANWDDTAMETRVVLVDLDGLASCGGWNEQRRHKTLARLGASLIEYASVTRVDYARFLKRYFAEIGVASNAWKSVYRQLSQRTQDYLRRARGRKKNKLDGYGGV